MSRSSRSRRGTTIVELMTVIIVMGLLMSMLVTVVAPMLRSQSRSQAKLDTVQSAAAALYRIQRDLRQTSWNDAWACTTGASASCSQPAAFGATGSTTAIAFPTAYLGGSGQFQIQASGYPNWKGVTVYWIDSAGALHWAFDSPTGFTPGSSSLSSGVAAQAVADATTGVVSVTTIAANIQQLAVAFNPSQTNIISLQMQAQSTENGSVNETTYRSDLLARQ